MYSRILDFYSSQIVNDLENLFSFHMQSYSTAPDKEQHLKNMFADIFAEKDLLAVEPYVLATGEEFLRMFYQFIWFKLNQPTIENIGKKYFFELCEEPQQIYLIKEYKDTLQQQFRDIYNLHNELVLRFVPEFSEEQQEQIALFESNLISSADQEVILSPPGKIGGAKGDKQEPFLSDEEQKSPLVHPEAMVDAPKLIVTDPNQMDITQQVMAQSMKKSDFLSKVQPAGFSKHLLLTAHMESLFSGQKQPITKTFYELPKLLQDYISFCTWRIKGEIHGINDDFGRHSYLQTAQIGEYYHLNDEDRVNMLMQIQETLTNL